MNQERDNPRRPVFSIILSIIVGGAIVWFLLRNIELREIPGAISRISWSTLVISFLLYAVAVFFKAVRFEVILRTGIGLKCLFPVVALYTFFVNILPMRAGELSYVYLLKKRTGISGTRSFTSLVIGAVADLLLVMVGILVVGCYLRGALKESTSYFLSALSRQAAAFAQAANDNLLLCIVVMAALTGGIVALALFRRRDSERQHRIWRYASVVESKVREVWRELAAMSFDTRLLGILICSLVIIVFRFATQCYLVRSMGMDISIWKLTFALLFGTLFSLLPIHGPAGLGTVEAPWVIILHFLNVPTEDAITSGFSLHIIVIIYAVVMGIYGALSLKILPSGVDSPKCIEPD